MTTEAPPGDLVLTIPIVIVVLANFSSVPGILAGGLGGRVGVYS